MIPKVVSDKFDSDTGFSFSDSLVYSCFVGSKSHNTHIEKEDPNSFDDVDIFSVIVPPKERVYGLNQWNKNKQIFIDCWDVQIYPLANFVNLCLVGNPNIICTLWVREAERIYIRSGFEELIHNRHIFSSKKVVSAFLGYANDQFRRMTSSQMYQGYMGEKRKKLVEKFGFDPKNASHLLRLLTTCSGFCDTQEIEVYRSSDSQLFKDVKQGKYKLHEVEKMAEDLFVEVRSKLEISKLPKEPDRELANKLLISITENHWEQQKG